MAVQKSRKTRSKRGMRRSHDALTAPTISVDSLEKEFNPKKTLIKKLIRKYLIKSLVYLMLLLFKSKLIKIINLDRLL